MEAIHRKLALGVAAGFILTVLANCSGTAPQRESEVPAAPEVIRQMIEAHGGLEAWRAAPTVAFTEQWGEGPPTRVVVEQGSRRVYQEQVGGGRMAWDGERAWSVNWQGAPPRFTAQLNYYFLNLPWLTLDPGVNLGTPGSAILWDDSTRYVTVMMTFEPGVGDTPDDYYELYIHPETHRLHGCRYVVTYESLLEPGMEHTPDHILIFDRHERVDGLLVPTHFTIYELDQSVYAECTITDWSFAEPFDAAKVAMPADAVVDTTTP